MNKISKLSLKRVQGTNVFEAFGKQLLAIKKVTVVNPNTMKSKSFSVSYSLQDKIVSVIFSKKKRKVRWADYYLVTETLGAKIKVPLSELLKQGMQLTVDTNDLCFETGHPDSSLFYQKP